MALFVAGEAGKRRSTVDGAATWPRRLWVAGVVLCAVHMSLAMSERYGWNHEQAVRETAARSATVYGFAWPGALYVNYLFLLVWTAETVWWATWPRAYLSRRGALVWPLRAFYLVIIFNAVVIFARPLMRPAGFVLTAILVSTWVTASARPSRGGTPDAGSGRPSPGDPGSAQATVSSVSDSV